MSYDNLYHHTDTHNDAPLYLAAPNLAQDKNSGGACIQLPNGFLHSDVVDFLNDFGMAVERKAILIMRELVVGNPAVASEAYQYIPKLLQWLKQQKMDSSSFEELGTILGALVTTYTRNN